MNVSAVIGAISIDIDRAVDQILTEVEGSLVDLAALKSSAPATAERLQQRLSRVMEACAFQDLTGQRLAILADMTAAAPGGWAATNPLLNGPALEGQGLDQAATDRLLDF